jgi:hypothetical protein
MEPIGSHMETSGGRWDHLCWQPIGSGEFTDVEDLRDHSRSLVFLTRSLSFFKLSTALWEALKSQTFTRRVVTFNTTASR